MTEVSEINFGLFKRESDDEESEEVEVKQIQESNITSSELPQETGLQNYKFVIKNLVTN